MSFDTAAPARGNPWPLARPWLLMFVAAASLRAASAWLASVPQARPASGPATLDIVAWNLARGAGFSIESAGGLQPTACVPPLSPWITSLLYRAAGHGTFAAVLLGCVIGSLVPLLLAAFAARMFGRPAGRWAGWLAVLSPLLVSACCVPSAETPFTVMLLLAMLLSAEWVKAPRSGRAFGTGLAWGLAALAHPAALVLPVLVAAWAWGPLGFALTQRGRLRQIALLLLGLALAVGPWTLRNALVLNAFVPVATGASGTLQVAGDTGARAVRTFQDAWWMASPLRDPGPAADLLLLWSAVALALALWGLGLALRGPRRWFQSLSLGVILYFTWLGASSSGSFRVRVPIEPLALGFAAAGLDDLGRRLRVRRSGLRVVARRSP
jgi:4-amino-4-deoxy-L-arabinose transferase-like glycosyltransferase